MKQVRPILELELTKASPALRDFKIIGFSHTGIETHKTPQIQIRSYSGSESDETKKIQSQSG